MRGSVASASVIGSRPDQEDRWVATQIDRDGRRAWLLAVFDGHNGSEAAEAAAELLPEAWDHAMGRHGDARAAMQASIGVLRERTADLEPGSSVSVAYVDEVAQRAVVGILGDSPVVVRDADGRSVLGPIHNTATNQPDVQRAMERGAELVGPYLMDPRSGEGVNLTRTIGDAALTFLGREPQLFEASLGPDSFVCVASDGLFSETRSTPEELVRWIEESVPDGIGPDELVSAALADGSHDNVTVVLWGGDGS